MLLSRTLEATIRKISRQFPVLLVTGARQVGKTTLLKTVGGAKRTYVTLDEPQALRLAKEEPALFLSRFKPPLLIDEIQYAPELLPHIKMAADQDVPKGSFWLTGSQQFHLMQGVTESLAGRVGIIRMMGLSRMEILGRPMESKPFLPTPGEIQKRLKAIDPLPLKELYKLIWRGSFPAIALNRKLNWETFYGSYVQTYMQRDVSALAKVGDELAFLRFLRAGAARTGQLLNLSDLARDTGISVSTAKTWLSILITSGIALLLEPYHTNVTKRLVKTPKLYFLDTGLCAYLTEWTSPETLEAGAMSGAILETWVLGELLKGYWHIGRKAPFYFYRDKDQKEVDLLIVEDGKVFPVEIKKTGSPRRSDIGNFQTLGTLKLPIGPGGLICLTETGLPLTETAQTVPVALL